MTSPRSLTVLGATGSIGTSTLDLVARYPELFRVEALSAQRNVTKLVELAVRFRAPFVAIADHRSYPALKDAIGTKMGCAIECAAGPDAVVEAARRSSDLVMSAVTGLAGLRPTMAAIKRGASVLLANKESLVCAGALMTAALRQSGAALLPVDSEHNAIFQVFEQKGRDKVHSLVLTASGGPFRGWSLAQMQGVTAAQALAHPNWTMGKKITIDSATMMNKGLELIEAAYLFDMPVDKIDVVVHPQSIVHSMVNYVDGSVLAQLGQPDMRIPISYALGWPERLHTPVDPICLAHLGQLTFEKPDEKSFPALALARQALQAGGAAPVVLNAANEVAVAAFLNKKIPFLSIATSVTDALAAMGGDDACADIDDVIALDSAVRKRVQNFIKT